MANPILQGYISEEDITAVLSEGNARLIYNTTEDIVGKDVGTGKPVVLKSDSDEHFLSLTGEGSQYYELDRTIIPPIVGSIIQRPVSARFYNVIKIYDGTTLVDTSQLRYYFTTTAQTESGIVMGTDQYKPIMELQSNYKIVYPGINYKVGDTFTITGKKFFEAKPLGSIVVLSTNNGAITSIKINTCDYTDFPINHDEDGNYFVTVVDGNRRSDIVHSDDGTYSFYPLVGQYIDGGAGRRNYTLLANNNTTGAGFAVEIYFKAATRIVQPTIPVIDTGHNILPDVESDNIIGSINWPAEGQIFIQSDMCKLGLEVSNVHYLNKNVINDLSPLSFDAMLVAGPIGTSVDVNNYTLVDAKAYGQIIQRGLIVSVSLYDREYDGTVIAPWHSQVFENLVSGDEVMINDKLTVFRYEDKTVGTNKVIQDPNTHTPVIITGKDAPNYVIDFRSPLPTGSIYAKHVTCTASMAYFYRTTGIIEILYTINGLIIGDYVTLSNSGNIRIDTANTISRFQLTSDQYDKDQIEWQYTHLTEDDFVDIVTNEDNSYKLKHGQTISVENLSIEGIDANNYILDNDSIHNIPIRILDIH